MTFRLQLVFLAAFIHFAAGAFADELPGGALAHERPRVIVSSDVGGADPDDFQSMVHLLMYANVLDIEGLISSPPAAGRAKHMHECLDAYAKDFKRLSQVSSQFPPPEKLRKVVKQGATGPSPKQGFSEPTAGSKWIIQRAKTDDHRPLWVLVWGSITDVAQSLHDDPSIKGKLRVYSIGSWNTQNDQAARDYISNSHRDLWWIESDTTFRGMYMGGKQDGDLGNLSFVEQHVKGHGALGDFFYQKKRDIKMGDSPSVLYLLRGTLNDPSKPSWGGSYVKPNRERNYWHDDPNPSLQHSKRNGANTVNRWRKEYLRDWQRRMEWLGPKD